MLFISNRRIPILALPECPLPRLPRCKFPRDKPLEIRHDLSQLLSLKRHQQRMQMIWHDDKGIKRISNAIIMPQRRLDDLACIRFPENTRPITGIEPFLHCALKAFRILPRIRLIPGLRMLFKPNATIILKRPKFVHRQRIAEAKCHKDGDTRLLPMWKSSAPNLNRGKAGKKSRRRQHAVWDRPRPLRAHPGGVGLSQTDKTLTPIGVGLSQTDRTLTPRGVGLSQADIARSLFSLHLHWFANGFGLRLSPQENANRNPKHHNQHNQQNQQPQLINVDVLDNATAFRACP